MAAKYQNIYTMNVSIQQLRNIILSDAFASSLHIGLKSENPTQTGVWFRFHHGTSFTSWGEKITITLQPLSADSTQVTIHSECGMPTQVVDWGKNKQIVGNIYNYLASNLSYIPAQPVQQPVQQPAQQPVQQPAQPCAPKFCSQCGTPIKAGALFCTNCGVRIQ